MSELLGEWCKTCYTEKSVDGCACPESQPQRRRGLVRPEEPLRMQFQHTKNELAEANRVITRLRLKLERLSNDKERIHREALKLVGEWSAATAVVQGTRALAAWSVLASEGAALDSALRFQLLEPYDLPTARVIKLG